MKKSHRKILDGLQIFYGQFQTKTFTRTLTEFDSIFSQPELILHFPPNGKIELESFDHLFAINYKSELCGYYKVSIFDFSNEIELHAGNNFTSPFLNRSYFQLTKEFVSEIAEQFPLYNISVWVDPQNKKVPSLLKFVGFEKSNRKMKGFSFENYMLTPIK